jgi:DNA-binding IclR family transcriptional regulator
MGGAPTVKRGRKKERAPQRRILSIGVGFKIIRFFVEAEGYRTLKDIAAATGMPPGKAHLYLASFVREGMIHQDPETACYGLGPYAIQIGLAAIRRNDVIALSQTVVAGLRNATRCAAYVSVWGETGPVIAYRQDGYQQGSMTVRVGYVLPLLYSATGRVFLTYLPRDVTRPLLRAAAQFRPATGRPLDSKGIAQLVRDTVERVRAQGYATSESQINAGFFALSAPVLNHAGEIAAALTIIGPSQYLKGTKRAEALKLITGAAQNLSAELGYKP